MSNKPLITEEQRAKDTIAMFEAMATNGGGPSHPMQMQYGTAENGEPAVWFSMGMTKRETIAAMVISHLVDIVDVDFAADRAAAYADALLERLKK